MERKQIEVGLTVNFTNLDGYHVITSIVNDTAFLYSISGANEQQIALDDLNMGVNSSMQSMNAVPAYVAEQHMEQAIQQIDTDIQDMQTKLEDLRKQKDVLSGVQELQRKYNEQHT